MIDAVFATAVLGKAAHFAHSMVLVVSEDIHFFTAGLFPNSPSAYETCM